MKREPIRFGMSIAPSPRESLARFLSVVISAEQLGLSHVWVLDSQTLFQNAYIALGLVARETERIELGPGVTNLVTRHETVVANAMSTLALMAPGRVLVGVGTGDTSVRPIGLKPLTLAELGAGVGRLRALLRGESVEVDGREVSLAVVPDPVPRIYLAATRPRMLELAGACADGVVVVGAADVELLAMQMEAVDRGARGAGRRPGDVDRDLWIGLAIGEGEEPVSLLRSYALTQARLILGWPELPASLSGYVREMKEAVRGYDFRQHLRVGAEHARSLSDELVRRIAIAGTFDECRTRLSEVLALQPTRVSVTLLPRGRERRLEEVVALWGAIAST